jgi:hypothetical protein
MKRMIDASKEKELIESKEEAIFRKYDSGFGDDDDDASLGGFGEELVPASSFGGGRPARSRSRGMMKSAVMVGAAPPSVPVAPVSASSSSQPSAQRGTNVQPNDFEQVPAEAPTEGHAEGVIDYTKYPKLLDQRFEELDLDSALRPTILTPGKTCTKKSQAGLLATLKTSHLNAEDLDTERTKTFDLLDALSKSGALTIDHASLHVVIAATHCFDQSLLDVLVTKNVNPIERVERSALIMASTIHSLPARALLPEAQQQRLQMCSPMLFGPKDEEDFLALKG